MDSRLKKLLKYSLLILDRNEKGWLFLMGSLFGIAITYGAGYNYSWLYLKLINPIRNYKEIFQTIVGTFATICGIAIPISISTVSEHLKKFEDSEIAKYFQNEILFKLQLIGTLVLIVINVLLLFCDCQSVFLIGLVLVSFISMLIVFFKFIYKVLEYTTNTEEVIYQKTVESIDAFLDGTK